GAARGGSPQPAPARARGRARAAGRRGVHAFPAGRGAGAEPRPRAAPPSRGRGRLAVPLYCVITDFTAHPFWVFPHVDRYFVASERVADQLHGHGVPRERIEVSGIPIASRFARPIDRAAARARLGLGARGPVVLVMGGGSGLGPLADVAARLAALALEPRVLVVCGVNLQLR